MKKTILTALVLLLAGCSHRIGDFTIASTKNININENLHRVDVDKRVTGVDMKHTIIFFPTGYPDMKEAMDNAIEKEPSAVALSNVTVKFIAWYIPFIYGQTSYEIEGNPVYKK